MLGAIAHMDIMIFSTSSIIPQMTRFLGKSNYFNTHFFINNASD